MNQKEIDFFTFLLNSLRKAQDENTKALQYNTSAIIKSTEGIGRWEKKDEYYHKEHHKILLKILKVNEDIYRTLKMQELH